jgi:hypothetical protein
VSRWIIARALNPVASAISLCSHWTEVVHAARCEHDEDEAIDRAQMVICAAAKSFADHALGYSQSPKWQAAAAPPATLVAAVRYRDRSCCGLRFALGPQFPQLLRRGWSMPIQRAALW